jgi:TRAP-type mannitol/chloroaromatic compound transport system permease small subunit
MAAPDTWLDRRLRRMAEGLDRLCELTGSAVAWLSLSMVLVTFVIVVLRYAFGLGWIWLQESVTYMHAALFLIGAA